MKTARCAALAAAALAAMAITAAPATAKTFKYEGAVDLLDLPGSPPAPRVEFKVNFAGKTPTSILFFKQRNVYQRCTDGSEARYNEDGSVFEQSLKVNKKRRFGGTSLGGGAGDSFKITGVVPRKGPVRGTLRIRTHFDAIPPTQVESDCDTGLLNWTASR